MSDSVKNKIGYFIFVVIVGVLFGIGPFHGGHDLLKISIASPSSSVIKSVEKSIMMYMIIILRQTMILVIIVAICILTM